MNILVFIFYSNLLFTYNLKVFVPYSSCKIGKISIIHIYIKLLDPYLAGGHESKKMDKVLEIETHGNVITEVDIRMNNS